MKKVGLYEAKTNLSALVAELEAGGGDILLTRHGKAVAQLSLPKVQVKPTRGALKSSAFAMAEDFDDIDVGFADYSQLADDLPVGMVAEGPARYD
ncbi:type II toxin-antitoxin system Phd/YefM family antitoxin [Persicirhabdus sediminis]|uniref:Antitoxin n=1 Tax=Persicirhabdus sediminis TaxID=454144 RepID=A0A8J7MKQ2_9BACT|nr:type II toxin-antitoxin system Phd/YefM family antitoxin [Persicirhabdus sediminis]MBK1792808.1 type II toxin-antitoxin system Phd/YefM family antitoxin [Persicirhabdus sediminis]